MLNAHDILTAAGLRQGMHLAEFGTSRTGHFPLAASKIVGDDGQVYGIDLLPEVLSMLGGRSRLEGCSNVAPVWGDYEREGGVDIPEGSLDVALLTHTLPGVQNPDAFGRELSRLLKPGGRVVVVDWDPSTNHPMCPDGDRCLPPQKAEALLRRLGLTHEEWFEPADTHWGGVWRNA